MKVVVTGATGTIGRAVVKELEERGDTAVALSRNAARASEVLGPDVEVHEWGDPKHEAAPAAAFTQAEGVIHLLGEPLAQRWNDESKREILDSRVLGTRNLIEGLRRAGPRLSVLVSQSAVGFYGPRDDRPVDESAPPGNDFPADVAVAWETEGRAGGDDLGLRVALCRTGVVLSRSGGALEKMLTPFKLGVGGPVAGGGQYMSWVHMDDVVGALLFALDTEAASGPLNVTAPEPVTNGEFSKALGRALRRPALFPVPGFAISLLYGEMATIVTSGVRAKPKKLLELGYEFRRPELDEALEDATGRAG